MKKLKLNLDEIKVESFETNLGIKKIGTVNGLEDTLPTCISDCTMAPRNTCVPGNNTCYGWCTYDPTCPDTCVVTCITCDQTCGATCGSSCGFTCNDGCSGQPQTCNYACS